jgi:phosphoribosyl-ATP pyrophosphohydrolase/phosphoribosyl-AMP cyclohydrolase
MFDIDSLDFEKGGGLVTVVAQHANSGAVLMLAHADREAIEKTLASGEMHYRSRTRGLWHKGATSGHVQHVVSLHADCDGDAVLARVRPAGPACHTGAATCFGDDTFPDGLRALASTLEHRIAHGESTSGYTNTLFADRNLRLKKIGEEAAELVTACADGDPDRAREEAADLFYHALVALRSLGVTLRDVEQTLSSRAR